MPRLDNQREQCLIRFVQALVDQHQARVAIPPRADAPGFWFGGGNMVRNPHGGLCLVGRYRNHGDSRTGLGAGERGLELAVFEASDPASSSAKTVGPFTKTISLTKQDLDVDDRRVLSIEGCALRFQDGRVELFVSTEKSGIGYPDPLESYLKPRTGVWTIDRLTADSIESLGNARPTTILESRDPRWLHVKDPVVYEPADGGLVLLFCTHPFSWTSSNSAYAVRPAGGTKFERPRFDFFRRGFAWDVAMTRVTAVLDVPPIGLFRDQRVSLVFYDGGECVRNLEEHTSSVRRPRGYSCEELGGAAYFVDGALDQMHRLSQSFPLLVSPHGTGCSRYVDVLDTGDAFVATWQQAQADGSQPLVVHSLARQRAENILAG